MRFGGAEISSFEGNPQSISDARLLGSGLDARLDAGVALVKDELDSGLSTPSLVSVSSPVFFDFFFPRRIFRY